MAIEIIDQLKQKNNSDFPIVDINDVKGGIHLVENIDDLDLIPEGKKKLGMLCYVSECPNEIKTYQLTQDGWIEAAFGGGVGTSAFPDIKIQEPNVAFAYEEDIKFYARITSPNRGVCKIYYTVINLSDRSERTVIMDNVKQGVYTELFINEKAVMERAEYQIRIYGEDIIGIPTQEEITLNFKIGSLEISSSFRDGDVYSTDEMMSIPYKIDCVEGDLNPINVYITVDEDDVYIFENLKQGSYIFDYPDKHKTAGQHSVKMTCETITLKSNEIEVKPILASAIKPSVIMDSFEPFEFGSTIEIGYKVVMLNYPHDFEVVVVRDGEVESPLNYTIRNNVKGYMSLNKKPYLDIGVHTLKIYARATNDHSVISDMLNVTFEIVESTYNAVQPTSDGLWFYYDAEGKTNTSENKTIWEDLSPNRNHANLYNFNFETNGWLKDSGSTDTYLKLNGNTYCEIPIKPFETNFRGKDGFTMEVLYRTRNIGDVEARVIDCSSLKSPFQGLYVNTDRVHINSKTTALNTPFQEESWTHVTYQISKQADFLRMLIFINGSIAKIVVIDAAEDYMLDNFIYLNTSQPTIDSLGTHLSHQGESEVRIIRGYDRVLTMDEIMINYISTITDLSEQKIKYELNMGGMDTVTFYGNVFELTNPKDPESPNKNMNISVRYTGKKSGRASWYRDVVNVSWQGTSTLAYPIKNYKLKINVDTSETGGNSDDHTLYVQADEKWHPEKVFTMKADYMESSHRSNTGTCNFAHDLYEVKLPPAENDEKIRSCIAGFPVQLLVEYEENGKQYTTNMGIYQFNLDKNSTFTLGFEEKVEQDGVIVTQKKPNCFSFEVGANDDVGAGAFKRWDEDSINAQWEVRYAWDKTPDDKPANVTKLRDFIQWVATSTEEEFKRDAHLHLDLGYTLDYLLMVYTFGMVDNLGKNMMMSTWDLERFYPCFYDMDTIMGTDNFGHLRIEPDGDITGGLFFNRVSGDDSVLEKAPPLLDVNGNPVIDAETGKEIADPTFPYHRINVFNTSGSELWRKIRVCFKEELGKRYTVLRNSGKFTVENIMKYYGKEQPQEIGEKFYNDEYRNKYEPYPDQLFRCNGDKIEHRTRWLTERLRFVDSVFAYGGAQDKMVIRVNSNMGENVLIGVRTASPILITVDYGNDDGAVDTIVTKRCSSNEITYFKGRVMTDRDREVSISFSPEITELGNLQGLKPSGLQITYAKKLTNINVSNNQYLTELSVSNNPSLVEINCSNCSSLIGTLDVSGCTNLKKINCSDTKLTNLRLVSYNPNNPSEIVSSAGSLQELIIKNSNIRVLDLLNQAFLKEIDLTDCMYLAEINLINCSQMTRFISIGSTLRVFKTSHCNLLEEIDLSSSSALEEFTISNSPSLKKITLYKCSNTKLKQLDLLACQNLEYLNVSQAGSLNYIRLPQNTRTLKELYLSYSAIKGIGYGIGEIADIIDLDGLPLEKFDMYWCRNAIQVANIKLNVGSNSRVDVFNECTSLVSVEGELTFNTSMGSIFRATKLATFPIMITPDVTNANSAFQSCKITTEKAKEILAQLPKLRSSTYMFYYCSEVNGEIPDDMFINNNQLYSTQYMFNGTNITSLGLQCLKHLPSLKYANYMFASCSKLCFTMPHDFFINNKELLQASYMFSGTGVIVPIGKLVNGVPLGEKLFETLTKIQYMEYMFNRCNFGSPDTTPKETTIPSGMFKNNTSLVSLRGIFNGSNISGIVPETLFSTLKLLENTSYMFNGCSGIGGQLYGTVFANNLKLKNISYMLCGTTTTRELSPILFNGCPDIEDISGFLKDTQITGQIPDEWFDNTNHALISVSSLFEGCKGIKGTATDDKDGLTGHVPQKLFWNQPNLKYANAVYKNCQDLNKSLLNPNLSGVPEALFKHSLALSEANELFMGCVNIVAPISAIFKRDGLSAELNQLTTIKDTFRDCIKLNTKIPSDYFCNCESVLNASGQFRGCRAMKDVSIPETLFGIVGINGNLDIAYLPKVQDLSYFFEWCNNLYIESDITHIYAVPERLLQTCYSLMNIQGMFKNCGLKGMLHADTFRLCSNLVNVSYLFSSYYSENEQNGTIKQDGRTKISGIIPSILFDTFGEDDRHEPIKPRIVNFSSVFAFNDGLTGIGSELFSNNIQANMNFDSALSHCGNIIGIAPKLWDGAVRPNVTGVRCFWNCNFSNQIDIPTNWK